MNGVNWLELNWEVLAAPAWMGAVVAFIVIMFFKRIVDALVVLIPDTIPGGIEQKERLRAIIIMALTFGLAYLLALWRLKVPEESFALAIAASALAVYEYEFVKNALGAVGVKLPAGYFGAPDIRVNPLK